MKVGLCAIAKNEDMYVDHWVKHYFDRGFDVITIYDNNDEKDLVCKDKRVEIINVHGKIAPQLEIYKEYFEKNKDKVDWIAYFDLDEFLDCRNIKDVLNKITPGTEQVQIKLMDMSDNGYLKADYSKSPFERFTTPCQYQWHSVKSVINTCAKNVVFNSVHCFTPDTSSSVYSNNEACSKNLRTRFKQDTKYDKKDYNEDEIVIHHCDTKTIEEYIKYKFNRTDARFQDLNKLSKPIPDRSFFKNSKKTLEKLKILSKAPYNGFTDLILDSEKEYNENLLNKYRKIYIKDLKEDMDNNRVLALKSRDPIDIKDLAEFYIEDGIEKRKSLGQIKKYFS